MIQKGCDCLKAKVVARRSWIDRMTALTESDEIIKRGPFYFLRRTRQIYHQGPVTRTVPISEEEAMAARMDY